MAKKEEEIGLSLPEDMPTIKNVVDCPKCGAKIEVEFEIELAPLIPMLTESFKQKEKKEAENDKD